MQHFVKYFLYLASVSVLTLSLIVMIMSKSMAHGSDMLYLALVDISILGLIASVAYGYVASRME